MKEASNTAALTQFIDTKLETYAYRRFGKPGGFPIVFLQHFTGTLDNWDPAVTDAAGIGPRCNFVWKRRSGAFERRGAHKHSRHGEAGEHLFNAMLLTYPDVGHGSLFQSHGSFVRQASLLLGSDGIWPS